jgi:hypothetical protein
MPPCWTYRGASPGTYVMERDAYGVLLGLVKPGDVIERDDAPDADWQPYDGGGRGDETGTGTETTTAGSGQEEG